MRQCVKVLLFNAFGGFSYLRQLGLELFCLGFNFYLIYLLPIFEV